MCLYQKSMDHRGTADFPGFVVTLVKEDELEKHNYVQQLQQQDQDRDQALDTSSVMIDDGMFLPECIGNVYLVPQDEAHALIGTCVTYNMSIDRQHT